MGLIAFAGGTRLVLDVDMGANPTIGDWGFVLTGDSGMLRVTTRRQAGRENFDLQLVSLSHENFNVASEGFPAIDPWVAQVHGLVEWLDGGPEHIQSFARTMPSHEALIAIYESARTRTRVTLPVQTRRYPLEAMIGAGQLPIRHPGAYDIRRPSTFPPTEV